MKKLKLIYADKSEEIIGLIGYYKADGTEPISAIVFDEELQYRIRKNSFANEILATVTGEQPLLKAIRFYIMEMGFDIKIEKLS